MKVIDVTGRRIFIYQQTHILTANKINQDIRDKISSITINLINLRHS